MLNKINTLTSKSPTNHQIVIGFSSSIEFFKRCLLPVISVAVKDILSLSVKFFLLANVICPSLSADEVSLGVGEHFEQSLESWDHFSVGNKEVLKAKTLKATKGRAKTLLIKGHRQGHSEILLWNKGGIKKKLHFFVLSKVKKLQQVEVQNSLQQEGLTMKQVGKIIVPQGLLKSRASLQLLAQLYQSEDIETSDLKMDWALKKSLVTEVYRYFFDQHMDSINCQFQHLFLLCYVSDKGSFLTSPLFKEQQKKWPLVFFQSKHPPQAEINYKITMRLFAFERADGREIQLGTTMLQSLVKDLLEKGPITLIEQNAIKLQSHDMTMTSLAKPEGLLIPGEEVTFAVGSEIPIQRLNRLTQEESIEWKFVGLKTTFKAEKKSDYFLLDYETEYSKPQNADGNSAGSVVATKEKGKVYLSLNRPQYLFNIDLQIEQKMAAGIPVLRSIPLFGHLFQGQGQSTAHKKIIGVIEIQEQNIF